MPLKAMPGEPGGAELAVAASAMGLQTWVSPLHIWHLLSGEAGGALGLPRRLGGVRLGSWQGVQRRIPAPVPMPGFIQWKPSTASQLMILCLPYGSTLPRTICSPA